MMLLTTAKKTFIESLETQKASPETIKAYRLDIEKFIRHVVHETGKEALTAFTAELVEGWYHHLRTTQRLSDKTLARRQTALRAFAKWGLRKRYWLVNPMLDVPVMPDVRGLPKPFAPDERDRLMALPLEGQERVLRAVLYYLGLRVGEIVRIRLRDFVRPSLDAQGEASLTGLRVRGKGDTERVVPVHPACYALIHDLVVARPEEDRQGACFLFTHRHGLAWSDRMVERRTHAWGLACDPVVEACIPHRFRHTFATDVLETTNDISRAQVLLGHASIATTQGYAKVTDRRKEQAILGLPTFGPPRHPSPSPETGVPTPSENPAP